MALRLVSPDLEAGFFMMKHKMSHKKILLDFMLSPKYKEIQTVFSVIASD